MTVANKSGDPTSGLAGELTDIAQKTCEWARAAGADAAEVLVRDGSELTTKVRMGEPELVQEAGSRSLGLRVFKDGRQSNTYTSDMRDEPLRTFVREAVALAEVSEPDELNRLPDDGEFASDIPELDLYDPSIGDFNAEHAIASAKRGEAAALAFDKRITNSEGATWSRVLGATAFANTAGFAAGYRGSFASFYVQPIADDADDKKRNGFWWTAGRFADMLEPPEAIGQEAARRTIATLGSRKVDTCEVPIVFAPEAARALAGMIVSVANGSAFYRKTTYLLDRENTKVASELVTLVDDPHLMRGPGSKPFDGDGLPTRNNVVVNKGVLETVLCDVYSARKLGRKSTGSASRGVGGTPGPSTSNLILLPGTDSQEDIVAATERGLYVDSMMGFGFNPVTGDFSRGASGFWIENGEKTFPVSEITISANFDDLLQRIDRVGSDIDRRSSTQVPTVRVSHMTIAGK